jgi:hypothetical protein
MMDSIPAFPQEKLLIARGKVWHNDCSIKNSLWREEGLFPFKKPNKLVR